MANPQVNMDDKPRWAAYILPPGQRNGPMTAADSQAQAANPGSEWVDMVVDRRDAGGRVYASDIQGRFLLRAGWRGAIDGGGTTGAARGGGTTGAALAATQANLPGYTGGGQGFQVGAQNVNAYTPQRGDEYKGLDSYNPDNKVSGDYSPKVMNWDAFRRMGSRCVRAGVAKLTDDIRTVRTSGAAVLNSDYRGHSLLVIPGAGDVGDQLMESFIDKDIDIGVAPGANVVTSHHICDVGPAWGRPRDMNGMIGPSFALSNPSTGVLRVTYVYTGFGSDNVGLAKQTIKAVSIRYVGPVSGATPRHPRDIDGLDGTDSVSVLNRAAWATPTANTIENISGLAAGKYWVSLWGLGIEGQTERTYGSLTIT